MPIVAEILSGLEQTFPLRRAESWDKVGLQVGSRQASVKTALAVYDVTPEVLDEAGDVELLVCYHPLLFRPLDNLDFKNPQARLVGRLLAAGQNLVSVHTALDGAPTPHALGDSLAASLGLAGVTVLAPSGGGELVKIVTFVPPEALVKVSQALWEAGAGQIGRYDQASFRHQGTGTYRPLEGAHPYSGRQGELEEADEWRLEVIVAREHWQGAVGALKDAHPYEEVAYDVLPLLNTGGEVYGPARLGKVEEQSLDQFAAKVHDALQPPAMRLVDGGKPVRKVACSPGSGASMIDAAARAGADVLVTGDIKHHDALKARSLGLAVIDVTHAATERGAVPLIAAALQKIPGLQVRSSAVPSNPFR